MCYLDEIKGVCHLDDIVLIGQSKAEIVNSRFVIQAHSWQSGY
jgi:hypothetical protein